MVKFRSLRSFTVMNHYVENTKKLTVAFEKDHQAAKEVQQGSKPDNRNSPFTDTSRVHTRSELANITNQNYLSPLSNNVQKRKRINSNVKIKYISNNIVKLNSKNLFCKGTGK